MPMKLSTTLSSGSTRVEREWTSARVACITTFTTSKEPVELSMGAPGGESGVGRSPFRRPVPASYAPRKSGSCEVRSGLPIPAEVFAGGLTAAAALPYEERNEKGRCVDPNSDYFASDEIEYFSTFCRGRCGACTQRFPTFVVAICDMEQTR
jgi:hypothetical protein